MDDDRYAQRTESSQFSHVDNAGAAYHHTGAVYNGPVNLQMNSQDNSRQYSVPKEDNLLVEVLSRSVISLLGERGTLVTGVAAVLVGIGLLVTPLVSVPAMMAWLVPGPTYGVALAVAGVLLLGARQYKNDHECVECGEAYSLKEVAEGQVREVDTPEGVRRATTRTYACRECGHRTTTTKRELIPHDPTG